MVDRAALRNFYGAEFIESALPTHASIETIPTKNLGSALERATRNTSKGPYHKIRHCSALLKRLDHTVVRSGASYCERLFTTLAAQMGTTI